MNYSRQIHWFRKQARHEVKCPPPRPRYTLRGILNGSITRTIGFAKRSSDRLSCMAATRSPQSEVDTSDLA